jgi:cell division protease FtsH
MALPKPFDNKTGFHIGYWVVAFLIFAGLQYIYAMNQRIEPIPYSQFEQLLRDRKIAELAISDRYIQGKLKSPLPGGKTAFVTTRVDPQFASELQKYGVSYTGEVESKLLATLLSWILPVVIFFGIWSFLLHRMRQGMGGGLMSIGKSKAKIYVESDTGVRFDDVAGVDEAKDELRAEGLPQPPLCTDAKCCQDIPPSQKISAYAIIDHRLGLRPVEARTTERACCSVWWL